MSFLNDENDNNRICPIQEHVVIIDNVIFFFFFFCFSNIPETFVFILGSADPKNDTRVTRGS